MYANDTYCQKVGSKVFELTRSRNSCKCFTTQKKPKQNFQFDVKYPVLGFSFLKVILELT